MLTAIARDLRYAVRSLRGSPAFAATTLVTLSLAVGATTTVFTVLDRVLLRPLPLRDASRVVAVYERHREGNRRLASYPTYLDWQSGTSAFAGLGFGRGTTGVLQREDGPERLVVAYVTPGYLDVLGTRPAVGRAFAPDEEQAGGAPVAVLSHRLWRERFGGDRSIVGRTVTLDSAPVTVIGVLPDGAVYPLWADLWRPIAPIVASDLALSNRDIRSDSRVIARLRDGVTIERALADLAAIQSRLSAEYGGPDDAWTAARLVPLRDEVVGDAGPTILLLGAAVALVFLIACSNVAGLSLVRASVRARELAIRTVLGASRARIARQLVTESAVLGVAAGALGLIGAGWMVAVLGRWAPPQLPRAPELAVDLRVAAFAMAVSVLAALVFGLAPLVRRDIPANTLHGVRAAGAGGRSGSRVRSALTAAQLALAVILLVGAGLLIQSLRRAGSVDVGFDPARLTAFRIWPPSPRYDAATQAAGLYRRVLESVAAVPGVASVGLINHPPLTGGGIDTRVVVPGRTAGRDGALYSTASTAYLEASGIPLLRGRWFTDADMMAPGGGVVISEALADAYWPGAEAVGQPITIFRSSQSRPDYGEPIAGTVIGVVGSVRHFGIESDPTRQVYVPYTLETWAHSVIVIRVAEGRPPSTAALRRAILDVDPALPVGGSGPGAGFEPMAEMISFSLATRRYSTGLLAGFAGCALLLATIGIYGVLAYAVAHRTREMGIRLALGATPRTILSMIVGQGARLAIVGILPGTIAAAASSRLLGALLYDTSPLDATIFAAAPIAVLITALVACLVPAARAASTDPAVALRAE